MTIDNVLLPFVRREAKRRSADFAALSALRLRPPPPDSRHQPRRFPPPWDIEDNRACFIVRDHNGQALSCASHRQTAGACEAALVLTWLPRANLPYPGAVCSAGRGFFPSPRAKSFSSAPPECGAFFFAAEAIQLAPAEIDNAPLIPSRRKAPARQGRG